jgi:hypothetical protein
MKDKRENAIQGYRQLLEQYGWSWFATLKITSGIPSERRAKNLCDKWLSDLRRTEGDENFRWFRVPERGASGSNLHFHVLVGGLRNRRKVWQQEWSALGGDAVISKFDPNRKAILYLLKGTGGNGDLDFDFELPTPKSGLAAGGDLSAHGKATPASVRVDRLDERVTVTELKRLFKPFGRIWEVGIVESAVDGDRTSMSASVTFSDTQAARNAARELDGFELRGLPVRVSVLGESGGKDVESC